MTTDEQIKHWKERAEEAEAACAEMRPFIVSARAKFIRTYATNLDEAASMESGMATPYNHALSSDCGKGWLSPERAQKLRGALNHLAGYSTTVRTDRRKVVDETIMCLQTEDWCNGLLEVAIEADKALEETK